MFTILFYDVNEKRCNKMLTTCRKYLTWIQNSVLEGEISEANYARLIREIKDIISEEEGDSIVVYRLRTTQYSTREVYGRDKKGDTQFI